MTFWDFFRIWLLPNLFFWWFVFIAAAVASYPLVRRLRLWQQKQRFIESQGRQLQNPQNADARFQLANIYAEGGGWRKALVYAQDAVRIAEESPLFEGRPPHHFLRLLGEACLRRGRHDEAVAAFRRALQEQTRGGPADALFGLGRALLRKGDLEAAASALREALHENGSNLEAYFRLAQALAGLGRDADVAAVRSEFRAAAAALPRFARKRRLRWRAAFLLFPLARRIL
ncbi:MAG TPA: tetratricopeptide repeat protein [Planctomycetota bacterium]|nr:tetratricopeptide repeat protein [Planctomycetota bacterium]